LGADAGGTDIEQSGNRIDQRWWRFDLGQLPGKLGQPAGRERRAAVSCADIKTGAPVRPSLSMKAIIASAVVIGVERHVRHGEHRIERDLGRGVRGVVVRERRDVVED
jgi:hypothetical protein